MGIGVTPTFDSLVETVWTMLSEEAYKTAKEKGFWEDNLDPPALSSLKISQKLMLMSDELSEAHDAVRMGFPVSKKIPPFGNFEEELADVIIRILDLSKRMDLNVGGAIEAKMAYNAGRPHLHGKSF